MAIRCYSLALPHEVGCGLSVCTRCGPILARRDLRPDAWERCGTRFVHRPWFKVFVNTVLRLAQPRRSRKWVLCSIVEHVGPRPRCMGYEFARVKYEVPEC